MSANIPFIFLVTAFSCFTLLKYEYLCGSVKIVVIDVVSVVVVEVGIVVGTTNKIN